MAGGAYKRLPHDDDGKPIERSDHTNKLWVFIGGVFLLAMVFALRSPTTPDRAVPVATHRGQKHNHDHHAALSHPSSVTAKTSAAEAGVPVEAPHFTAPSFSAPSFEAPSFSAPSFEAPSFSAPSFEAPSFSAPSFEAPSFSAPSFSAPSFSAPSFDAPSPDVAQPTNPPNPPPPPNAASPPPAPPGNWKQDADGRSKNPYIEKYITADVVQYWAGMEAKRKQNSDEIKARFGSWAPDRATTCNGCWTDDWQSGKFNHGHEEGECPCDGHKYDNQTNWDMTRRHFCDTLNDQAEKDHPFPDELKYTLDLTFNEGLDENGDDKVPYEPLDSGQPSGELPFDPAVVRDHFLKLRAALAWYYQGQHILDDLTEPKPSNPKYIAAIQQISKVFAAAFVSGADFNVGTIGDSTVAGADNCFYDAWPNGIDRQLKPFFGAAKVDFTCRDGGHNGGFPMAAQIACAEAIAGIDADMIVQSSPFVHPDRSDPIFEDFVRRAAIEGVIVNVQSGAEKLVDTYARYGLTSNARPNNGPYGYAWYPSVGKSNWGRIDDGLCHVKGTRAGSSAVNSRNWHPGPLGHQFHQDALVFLWADAAVMALDEIIDGLKETGGKLDNLITRWQRRPKLTASELPTPHFCQGAQADGNRPHFLQLCDPNSPIKHGWASCITALQPTFGAGTNFKDVVVPAAEGPDWDGTRDAKHSIGHDGPKSTIPENHHVFFACRNPAQCKKRVESRIGTFETMRSMHACDHMDFEDKLNIEKGYTTIKLAKGRMKVGIISICGTCADKNKPPSVMLQADGIAKKALSAKGWDRNKEWDIDAGNDKCGTYNTELDAKALSGDVFLGVKCDGGGSLEYVFAQ